GSARARGCNSPAPLTLMQAHRRKHVIGQLGQSWINGRIIGGANDERINVAGLVDFSSFRGIEEESVAGANYGPVAQGSPCESDARSERFLGTIGGIVPPPVAVEPVAVGSDRSTQT